LQLFKSQMISFSSFPSFEINLFAQFGPLPPPPRSSCSHPPYLISHAVELSPAAVAPFDFSVVLRRIPSEPRRSRVNSFFSLRHCSRPSSLTPKGTESSYPFLEKSRPFFSRTSSSHLERPSPLPVFQADSLFLSSGRPDLW